MSFFAFIFFFIVVIILFGLSIIGGVIKAIFGLGRRSSSPGSSPNQTHDRESQDETTAHGGKAHKKIFDKEDGEYVDFEEVKDHEK